MVQREGFGLWKLLDKDHCILSTYLGIISIREGLFSETDKDRVFTGKVITLNSLGGWEIDNLLIQEWEN